MSKVRVTFTEKFFIEDHTITYHGVLIPLYGLLDEFINIYYIDIVANDVKLYYELKNKNNLSIEQKLRLIAETDRGRLIIKEFSEFGTNASFAETKRRFVPDWYINPNGPISSLTNGNHSYSEYYYLPLNSEERWKRYVGTLPPSVPLFVSLFQQTTNVLARIISNSSSRATSRASTPGRDSRDSTPDRGSLSSDGRLTVDAGEISSPLRTPAPSEYDTADERTPIASPTDIAFNPLDLGPQSESEILITEEDISKKDWPEDTEPLAPEPLAPPPSYDDSKKDTLVEFAPTAVEFNRDYDEINKDTIKSLLTPPSTIINFMQNALNIKYIKTDDEVRRLLDDPTFRKFFPKNFNESEDISLLRSQTVRAYTRLVVSLGYTYAKLSNLRELLAVQYKYFSVLSEEDIKAQVKEFSKKPPDFSSIKYKLTREEIEAQKALVIKELTKEEEQIKGAESANKIISQTVSSAKTYARKLLPLVDSKSIKFSNCPQLLTLDSLGELLNLIKHGSIPEITTLCMAYDITVPAGTKREAIGELIKTKLADRKLKDSSYLLTKFDIGKSGSWTNFTK